MGGPRGLLAPVTPCRQGCRVPSAAGRLRCLAASFACSLALGFAGSTFAQAPRLHQTIHNACSAQRRQQGLMLHLSGLSHATLREQVRTSLLAWQGVAGATFFFACAARSLRAKAVSRSLHVRRFTVATRAHPGASLGRSLPSVPSRPSCGEVQHFAAALVHQLPAAAIVSSLQGISNLQGLCTLPHKLVLSEALADAVHVALAASASPPVGLRLELPAGESAQQSRFSLEHCGAARIVGGTRQRVHRTAQKAGGAAAQQRTARRCVGARLQQAASPEVLAAPYDPSRLRMQIQLGLRASSRSGLDIARQVASLSRSEGSRVGIGVFLQCDHIAEKRSK